MGSPRRRFELGRDHWPTWWDRSNAAARSKAGRGLVQVARVQVARVQVAARELFPQEESATFPLAELVSQLAIHRCLTLLPRTPLRPMNRCLIHCYRILRLHLILLKSAGVGLMVRIGAGGLHPPPHPMAGRPLPVASQVLERLLSCFGVRSSALRSHLAG